MKIRIREDAKNAYVNRTAIAYHQNVNWAWANLLEKIQGMVIDVGTDFLFKDQFNTVPILGVSENGLRLMNGDVAEVIDDIRDTKMRCNWCGKISDKGTVCAHCGKTEYLEQFNIIKWWK